MDKIKERVQKLLNQAADREGTPEGDAFYDKAFELMASYGFDERDLGTKQVGDNISRKVFAFSGAYTDMQAYLLNSLVRGLHCVAFSAGTYRSTKVKQMTVFGAERHLDRVDLLFSLLNPQMIVLAKRVRAHPELGVSAVVARRSFMIGFASRVGERLRQAEKTVSDSSNGYAVALIDDAAKAEAARDAFAEEEGITLASSKSRRSMDADSYFQGVDAGNGSDIGQTRLRNRAALPR
ncbi:DUF2786 domain-containing protein [Corynebacterium lubricantis]|uniref:DUF2786 domain-containing protein n=1 Tax=Corynebacterium lubricantis TaxID=541095 RepID=UPI000381F9DB|nr:DUF2786 domain-containing protein [Corynebacterium lubricantis]